MGASPVGYSQFLRELREEFPVISDVGCIGRDGVYSPYSDACASSEFLSQYNILQYNYLFDKKNRMDDFTGQPVKISSNCLMLKGLTLDDGIALSTGGVFTQLLLLQGIQSELSGCEFIK